MSERRGSQCTLPFGAPNTRPPPPRQLSTPSLTTTFPTTTASPPMRCPSPLRRSSPPPTRCPPPCLQLRLPQRRSRLPQRRLRPPPRFPLPRPPHMPSVSSEPSGSSKCSNTSDSKAQTTRHDCVKGLDWEYSADELRLKPWIRHFRLLSRICTPMTARFAHGCS